MQEQITSKRNPRVQRIRRLVSSRQFRMSEMRFVLEGVRLIEEALNSGWAVREFYYSDSTSDRGKKLIKEACGRHIECYQVSEEVLREISDTETPQGVVAVLDIQKITMPRESTLVLILDAIRDPGNVGTILRTALAAGVDAVLVAPETADPFAPKVLRSAMGAQLKIPVLPIEWPEIELLIRSQGIADVLLADIRGGKDLWHTDLKKPLALIVCNEATGPTETARKIANGMITIPMETECESLNAAIAASLLVFEVRRQRQDS